MPGEHLVGVMTGAGLCVTEGGWSAGQGHQPDSLKRHSNGAGFSSMATTDSASRPKLSCRG